MMMSDDEGKRYDEAIWSCDDGTLNDDAAPEPAASITFDDPAAQAQHEKIAHVGRQLRQVRAAAKALLEANDEAHASVVRVREELAAAGEDRDRWVAAHERLRAELDSVDRDRVALQETVIRHQDTIARVKRIHRPIKVMAYVRGERQPLAVCLTCNDDGNSVPWPCQTGAALEGDG